MTLWIVARQAPLSLKILQARILEWFTMPFPRRFSHQGSNPGLLHCMDSLPSEPPGKPLPTYTGTQSPALWARTQHFSGPARLKLKLLLSEFITIFLHSTLVAQTVKCLSTMWETWVRSLGWEDPLEKEMAIHSSTIAWKIPCTEEPGRLQSMGSQRVRHD